MSTLPFARILWRDTVSQYYSALCETKLAGICALRPQNTSSFCGCQVHMTITFS